MSSFVSEKGLNRTAKTSRPTQLVEDGAIDVDCEASMVLGSSTQRIVEAVRLLRLAGVVVLRKAFEREAGAKLKGAVEPAMRRVIEALDSHPERPRLSDPESFAFSEACGRGPGRLDIKLELLPCADACEAVARRVAAEALGGDHVVIARGVVASFPGAAAQRWHRDGENLFPETGVCDLPPHAVTIFVPLVDVDPSCGPTQFLPGSHAAAAHDARYAEPVAAPAAEPLLEVGDVVVCDYRCIHRGGRNTSSAPRPIYYVVAARPWFVDAYNFPSRRSLFTRVVACVSRDEEDPADLICCVSTGAAYSEATLAGGPGPLDKKLAADKALERALETATLAFADERGLAAAALLAARERFTFVDTICFLRESDLRDRHLLSHPPAPAAEALGLAADLKRRATAALEVKPVPEIRGLGVFAIESIPARSLVAEYAGLVHPDDSRDAYALDYAQTLNGDALKISSRTYGNVARFVNHASDDDANAEILRCTFAGLLRVVIVATRTIAPGEQVLVDYGAAYWRGLDLDPVPLKPRQRQPSTHQTQPEPPPPPRATKNLVFPKFSLRSAHSALLRFVNDHDVSPLEDGTDGSALVAWRDLDTW
ncbi:hypothetical protein CTAYLR_006639 [Chrysophaeum taylorii]|uniref:SET domain-containing protein n=1 Tax=Chrysophaeum taylorii TaxID=2483200 RepID=A0AAD7UM08_9STRA|nr:hypothetical protein CTAYLR_006639 [Chrysophaeum taylorii]